MKKFYDSLREQAMKIINWKTEVIDKRLKINIWKIKNFVKLEIIVIILENKEVLHIA